MALLETTGLVVQQLVALRVVKVILILPELSALVAAAGLRLVLLGRLELFLLEQAVLVE